MIQTGFFVRSNRVDREFVQPVREKARHGFSISDHTGVGVVFWAGDAGGKVGKRGQDPALRLLSVGDRSWRSSQPTMDLGLILLMLPALWLWGECALKLPGLPIQ